MALPDDYQGGGLEGLKNSLSFERQKIAEWKEFHSETGHWPVASILFHYTVLAVFVTSVLALCYLLDRDVWDWSKAAVMGGAWLVFLAVLWVGGGALIRRFEERRYGRRYR